jgi:hypothetical protein
MGQLLYKDDTTMSNFLQGDPYQYSPNNPCSIMFGILIDLGIATNMFLVWQDEQKSWYNFNNISNNSNDN